MSVTLNASTSSGLVQTADTSGTIEIQSNGTTKLTVASTGAYGQLVSGTAQTAPFSDTSSINFTGIPSWVKRITVTLDGISFAAAGAARLRIGTSSGLATTGYSTQTYAIQAAAATTSGNATDGIGFMTTGANAGTNSGHFVVTNLSGNTWICTQMISRSDSFLLFATGSITLSASLDRLSLVAITSTFDAGSINILYEG